jgi:hypothetical protein
MRHYEVANVSQPPNLAKIAKLAKQQAKCLFDRFCTFWARPESLKRDIKKGPHLGRFSDSFSCFYERLTQKAALESLHLVLHFSGLPVSRDLGVPVTSIFTFLSDLRGF